MIVDRTPALGNSTTTSVLYLPPLCRLFSQTTFKLAARTAITSQIKAKAEMAAKSQKKFGNAEWEQFSDLIHMATQQEAAKK